MTVFLILTIVNLVLVATHFLYQRAERRRIEALRREAVGIIVQAEAILGRRIRAAALQIVDDSQPPPALPRELT